MHSRFFLIFITPALLANCTMIPSYKRPEKPVGELLLQNRAYQGLENVIGKKAADTPWKDFFLSQSLQKIIEDALVNNRNLHIAALNIEAARTTYRIQRSDILPQIEVTGTANRERTPKNASATQAGTHSVYSVNIGITAFEIDLFGRLRSSSKQALEQYFATEETRNATQISLIAEVVNAYLTYQADKKLLELTDSILTSQEQSYEIVSKSFEAGIDSKLNVFKAQTLIETARANHALYVRLVEQDKNALNLLVGKDVSDEILNAEKFDDIKILADLPECLSSNVLLERPDIKQTEHLLKAANANIGAARAAFFPSISLTGSMGLASASISNLFKPGSGLAWTFIPQITLPIFEGGRNISNLRSAKINQKIAVAKYELAIQTAFREVADELVARSTYTDQLKAQEALVAANQAVCDLTKERYKLGIDSYSDALDAQLDLYNSQQNKIAIQLGKLSNLVTLYKALGGGMK